MMQKTAISGQITPIIQRQVEPENDEEEEEEKPVQTKLIIGETPQERPDLSARFLNLRSNGRPLSKSERAFFEPRFGFDLTSVRLHSDNRAAETALAINARAFTIGQDIVFGAGQYQPQSDAGRSLLAHELTHTLQQSKIGLRIQRVCDPAALSGRTEPVFFPQERAIMQVFRGTLTLCQWTSHRTAVGLIQQALVDLCYDIGPHGPRGDGVDRKFGPDTAQGIRDFQTAEAITGVAAGEVDQGTLKCLDEVRSKRTVPCRLTGAVPESQYQIQSAKTGGRDEDIFFARGSAGLSVESEQKIARLAVRQKGCTLTLEGFISEDELVDFGPSLATDRINAVDAKFAAEHHNDPGVCPNPVLPLRSHSPLPTASSGVADYRSRRKVEVVPSGAVSTTRPCAPGAALYRSLTTPATPGASSPSESEILEDAIDEAVDWLDVADTELVAGNVDGVTALNAYFGGTTRRGTVRNNLRTWRRHLNTVVRTRNRHGTQCNTSCNTAIAFNQGRGSSAWMTVCPRFFGSLLIHAPLNQDEKKAFVVLHEAGHGSIGTEDIGYGHRRLIEFLSLNPALALRNTDSYTLMVLCLAGFTSFCSAPSPSDVWVGISSPADREVARRGLAWLASWLTWVSQDVSGVYVFMNIARRAGRWTNLYYGRDVLRPLATAFDMRRPRTDALPTFREQTMIAAIRDRYLSMDRATRAGVRVERDTSTSPTMRWVPGIDVPGRHVFLTAPYFLLTSDRRRVEALLPLIIAATGSISPVLRLAYQRFVEENIRLNRRNAP